ncbi:PAS domain S-box protein [Bacillus sp. V59.32b]|nr:PAS domain S-box protein [Bacillus sp. V59.32b]
MRMRSINIIDEMDLLLLEHIPAVTAAINEIGEIIYLNKKAIDFFAIKNMDDQGFPFVNEADEEYLLTTIRNEKETEKNSKEIQININGEMKWVTFQHSVIKLKQHDNCYLLTFFDITAYKKTDSFLNIKKKITRMIVKGASLPYVLNKLSIFVEELLHKEFHTGVLFLDKSKEHLHVAASPTLPQAFINRINGIKVSPTLGSCGPAIIKKKMVVCSDVTTDPNWEEFKDVALEIGIRSSWSFPIILDNVVIGAFTMYHSKSYSPTEFEEKVLEMCSYLIGLAAERDKGRKAVESYAEQSLLTLANSIQDIVIFKDRKGNWIETNDSLKEILKVDKNCHAGKNDEEIMDVFPENESFFHEIKTLTDNTLEHNQPCQKEVTIADQGSKRIYDIKTAILQDTKGVLLIGRDVTEKTRINDELVITKMELENTLKLQKAIICKFVKSGNTFKITMAKGDGLRNIDLNENKILGRTLEEVYPPDQLTQKLEYLERAWSGEELLYEDQLFGNYFLSSLKPIYKNKKTKEIIMTAMDITGFKTMEQKLKESERRYHSLLKNSPDAIYYENTDGVVIEANKAVEKITGYKVKEILNRPYQDFIDADYYDHSTFYFRQVLDGVPQRYESALITKSGEKSYVSVTSIPVFENKNVVGVFGMAKDITHEKKIVEKLRNTKEQLESFIENTSDSIIIMDLNGTILSVNKAFEKMFGWSKSEVKGKDIEIIQRDRKHEFNKYIQTITQGLSLSDWETIRYHKLGHALDISLSVGPIRDKQGNIIALSSIIRDITDRKKTEDLLRTAEQLAVIGQLAAGVAHEIRNPLTSLNGFLQLINEMIDKKEYIHVMRDELKRIEFITSEFLSLAKPHVKVFQKKDISQIVDGVVKIAEIQGVLKNVVIYAELEANLPLIECDENQLKQVFLNILKNAIESMEDGGEISITARQINGFVHIDFTDNGCGIPKERIKRIGEPFYSTKEKGTGLGMMISKKIINEHKGQLLIDSREGIGTTISILLPIIS